MTDRIINILSPLEGAGRRIFYFLKQHPEDRLRYQTSVRKPHTQYESSDIAQTSRVKVFSAMAPANPWARTCNTRPYKQRDGRSCAHHFISSSLYAHGADDKDIGLIQNITSSHLQHPPFLLKDWTLHNRM